jgi:hypothetical protein
MKELLEYMKSEWTVVSGAPWTFIIGCALVFGIAFAANRWRYQGIIETLKERLDTIKSRLEAKDSQLDEYRERLHLIPASGSEFSRMTHSELKTRALSFVTDARTWLAQWSQEERKVLDGQWQAMCMATDEAEKNRLWHQHTQTSSQISLQRSTEYDQKFKTDSVLLRDEMLSRLQPDAKDQRAHSLYEHPTNPIGMGMVADDLERMAKQLC